MSNVSHWRGGWGVTHAVVYTSIHPLRFRWVTPIGWPFPPLCRSGGYLWLFCSLLCCTFFLQSIDILAAMDTQESPGMENLSPNWWKETLVMDLKYFLAQFQFCYSVHKKIRNGQRRVFAGAGAGDVSAMIRSTKARSSVRVSSVLLLPAC